MSLKEEKIQGQLEPAMEVPDESENSSKVSVSFSKLHVLIAQNYSYVNRELLRRKYDYKISSLLMPCVGLVHSLSDFEAIRAGTNPRIQ